ncbi:hypothetical protein EAF04_005990 [Stromatinia cepivora]|nr:hypothetical protein EAF04_005990 [Stromatinia cepivora]
MPDLPTELDRPGYTDEYEDEVTDEFMGGPRDPASQLAMLKKTSGITIGKKTLASPMEALEYCGSLLVNLRYEAHTQLNNFLLGLANDTKAVLKLSPEDITREDLHTAHNISRRQHEADNRDAINKVEEDRARREKAIKMILTTVIHLFGKRFVTDLNKVFKACEPERALHLLNGELIARLREPPRPGRRADRRIMPSEFANVIKVLDGKRHELVWNMSDALEFDLRFNKIGMLGELSGDCTSLFPYKENVVSSSVEPPLMECQPKSVLANIKKWKELGITLSSEATSPPKSCIMDRQIAHLTTTRRPEQDDQKEDEPSTYKKPKACQCMDVSENKTWYSTPKDGYLARVVGWLAMVELVPKQPDDLCPYHTQQMGNALELITTRVKHVELRNRLPAVYRRKDDIDSIQIDGVHYSWFKHHEIAKTERQMKTLGCLKYVPPESEELNSPGPLNVKHCSDVSDNGYLAGVGLTVQHESFRQGLIGSSAMYRHHSRTFEGISGGLLYHCYFSPAQQLARRDLKLWRDVCRQRLDGEFRLVTIPLLMIEITADEAIDRCFTYGNLVGIFGDAQNKAAENCLIAYVKNNIGYDIDPPNIESKVFKNAKEKLDFQWQDIQGSWAIFAPGVPLRIRADEGGQGHEIFSAIPVPYVAVTLDSHGKLKPLLENGMTVTPIFDDSITESGKYVLPKFPVEISLPCSNFVEQALLGYVEWGNRMVVREARRLLAMSEEDFRIFYDTLLQAATEQFDIMLEEVATQERAYGDKSFYNDIGAGERGGWEGVDRGHAIETTSPRITLREQDDIPSQTQTFEPTQPSRAPADSPHTSPSVSLASHSSAQEHCRPPATERKVASDEVAVQSPKRHRTEKETIPQYDRVNRIP